MNNGTALLLLALLVSAPALGQSSASVPSSPPAAPSSTPVEPSRPQVATPALSQLSAPAVPPENVDLRVHDLEGQVENLKSAVSIAAAVLGLFLALGTFTSFFTLWRTERRAEESHRLSITGETAAQHRAAEVHHSFLEGSKTTLELVNETLELAKEASQRAARFLEERGREWLESLDREAKDLLATVSKSDDRALVADQRRRSALLSLAQKLASFEIIRFTLPREFKLSPPCLFIRGMEHHLNQQFDDALRYWRSVALDEKADRDLRSTAWYWVGYEHNNLGQFSQAVTSFEHAAELSSGPRSFELHRIRLESRFFDKDATDPVTLVKPFEELLTAIDSEQSTSEELEARRRKVCGTLGNIFYVLGEGARRGGRADDALVYFRRACDAFSQASERDQWARFGLAEALFRAGNEAQAIEYFRDTVLRDAQSEAINRMEPRTKVLGRQSELICYLRVPAFADRVHAMHGQVLESLGDVDQRLTVYSQVQRRNVSREQLREDLAVLLEENSTGSPTETAATQGPTPSLQRQQTGIRTSAAEL